MDPKSKSPTNLYSVQFDDGQQGLRLSFELVPEIGRVPEYVMPLDRAQNEKAEALLEKGFFIDLHQHPIMLTKNLQELTTYFRTNRVKYGYEGLRHGRWSTVCAAVSLTRRGRWNDMLPQRCTETPYLFEDILVELGFLLKDIERHSNVARRVSKTDDILTAKKDGKIGIIPILENLGIGNILDRLDMYYGFGIRMGGLTYSHRNYIGDGQDERYDSGLSEFGLDVVQRMNELGMVIDLAHSGFRTAMDAIEVSNDPVVFSHAGSYTLRQTKRHRKDEEVKAMAEKGGVIGVLAVPNSYSDNEKQGIDDVLDHLDYLVKLVGADHVGVGTDMMFGDHVGLHRLLMSRDEGLQSLPAKYMVGMESPSEGFNYVRGMIARGYSDQEIEKIMGGNAIRVLREVVG